MIKSSKNITFCAIFGALQIIFLLCAKYLEVITVSFYVLTSLALMMPFTQKMYKEGVLTYVAVSILSILLIGFPECFVYIFISGGYTLLFVLLRTKNVKIYFSLPIKIIFANLVLVFFYFVFNSFIYVDLSKFNIGLNNIEYYHYVIVVSILAVLYDLVISFCYRYLDFFAKRYFKQ